MLAQEPVPELLVGEARPLGSCCCLLARWKRRAPVSGALVVVGSWGRCRWRVGGNNTMKYCWITGLSFFPLWKAWSHSRGVVPIMTPQSMSYPSNMEITTPAFCLGILYALMCTQPTSNRNLAISRKKGSGMYALADRESKWRSNNSVGKMSKWRSPRCC